MKSNMRTHKKIFRYICENLDDDMNSARCRQIRKHLDGCTDCTAYLDSLRTTIALYRHYRVPAITSQAKKKLRTITRPQG